MGAFKRFNPFPKRPWFLRICSTSLLKTLREEEKLLIRAFSPFPTVFSTGLENFKNQNCHLQTLSVWKSLKFVVWERVNFSHKLKVLLTLRKKGFQNIH